MTNNKKTTMLVIFTYLLVFIISPLPAKADLYDAAQKMDPRQAMLISPFQVALNDGFYGMLLTGFSSIAICAVYYGVTQNTDKASALVLPLGSGMIGAGLIGGAIFGLYRAYRFNDAVLRSVQGEFRGQSSINLLLPTQQNGPTALQANFSF